MSYLVLCSKYKALTSARTASLPKIETETIPQTVFALIKGLEKEDYYIGVNLSNPSSVMRSEDSLSYDTETLLLFSVLRLHPVLTMIASP